MLGDIGFLDFLILYQLMQADVDDKKLDKINSKLDIILEKLKEINIDE